MYSTAQNPTKLSPDVTKILYVKQLPFKITSEELYELFGRYGGIRQIRFGNTPATKGKAFVVYDDIYDAQKALEHLNGFQVGGRYLVITYFKRTASKTDADAGKLKSERQKEDLALLKSKYNITGAN